MTARFKPIGARLVSYLVAAIFLSLAANASAAPPAACATGSSIFDSITSCYQSASTAWFQVLQGYANTLFWLLAAIELAWAGITWALEKDNLTAFTAALVKKIMGIGFFYALLLNAGDWIPAIINSMRKAGQDAAGVPSLSPSAIVDEGINAANALLVGVKDLGLFDSLMTIMIAGLSAIGIIIAFVVIAGQLMVALIESYIAIGAGVLFLGFGGSRWTTDFTQKYISYAFATGVKLFMLYLIIGLGMTSATGWATLIQQNINTPASTTTIFSVFGGSLILCFMAWQVPSMAAAMLSGSPSLTAGAGIATAASIGAGTLAAGGAVISPALREARGGMQAASSGFSAARAEGNGVMKSAVSGLGHAGGQIAREVGRNVGSATGLMRPTDFTSQTVGGRASQALDQRADTARERNAAMGGSGSSSTSNNGSSAAPSASPSEGGAASPNNGAPYVPPPRASAQGGSDSAAASVGAAAVADGAAVASSNVTAAASGSDSAASAATSSSDGTASAAAPAAVLTSQTAAADQAAATAGISPASGAAPAGAVQGAGTDASSASASGAAATIENAADKQQSATSPGDKKAADDKDELPKKDFAPSRLKDIRPPQLPPDASGGGTVHIRLNHTED